MRYICVRYIRFSLYFGLVITHTILIIETDTVMSNISTCTNSIIKNTYIYQIEI